MKLRLELSDALADDAIGGADLDLVFMCVVDDEAAFLVVKYLKPIKDSQKAKGRWAPCERVGVAFIAWFLLREQETMMDVNSESGGGLGLSVR